MLILKSSQQHGKKLQNPNKMLKPLNLRTGLILPVMLENLTDFFYKNLFSFRVCVNLHYCNCCFHLLKTSTNYSFNTTFLFYTYDLNILFSVQLTSSAVTAHAVHIHLLADGLPLQQQMTHWSQVPKTVHN